jgi:hypothetical protein
VGTERKIFAHIKELGKEIFTPDLRTVLSIPVGIRPDLPQNLTDTEVLTA